MKKFLMVIAAAFVAVNMNAQYYLGGSVGLSSTSYDGKNTYSTANLIPELGYQLNEDWAIGVQIGVNQSTNKTGAVDLNTTSFTFKPYARYTVMQDGKVKVFCDGGISYTNRNAQTADGDKAKDNKTGVFAVNIEPGIAYSLSDRFSVVAHVGRAYYQSSKPDYSGAKATNTLGINLSNSLTFGLYYNF